MRNYLVTYAANLFFNQYFLLFVAAALGALLGRVRVKGFTLGSTGGIFTGIVIGWAVTAAAKAVPETSIAYSSTTNNALTVLNNGVVPAESYVQFIFLLLFIGAVGLMVGKKLKQVFNMQGLKLIIMGIFIPVLSMALTFGCLKLAPGMMGDAYNGYQVSGLFSGAMTNSAALGNSMSVVSNIDTGSVLEKYAASDAAGKVRALEMIELITVSGDGTVTLHYTDPENPETLTVPAGTESVRDYLTDLAERGELELPGSLDPQKGQVAKFLGKAKANISTGYAITFPVGTVVVILTMTLIGIIVNKKKTEHGEQVNRPVDAPGGPSMQAAGAKSFFFDAVVFGLVIGAGIILGNIRIPLGGAASFSLGPVGGVLISALVFGNVNKIGSASIIQNPAVLNLIREFALLFFMTVIGLSNGYEVIHAFGSVGIVLALMAVVIVLAAILLSIVLGRFVLKMDWGLLSGAISGGCTSTVGLGAALNTIGGEEPIIGYGVSQPFAILANVLLIAWFHQYFFI